MTAEATEAEELERTPGEGLPEGNPADPYGLDSRAYKRGKWGCFLNELAQNFAANFVSATYLAAMMIWLGISASRIAFVLSLSSFGGCARAFAPYVAPKVRRTKLFVGIGMIVHLIPMAALFFLPLLPEDVRHHSFFLILAVYAVYCFFVQFLSPAYAELRELYAEHDAKTERFYAVLTICQNVAQGFSFLALTVLCNQMEGSRDLYPIFGGIALVSFLFRIIIYFILIREPKMPKVKSPGNFFAGMADMIRSKKYRPFLLYAILVAAGNALITGIETVFFVERMGLSITFISLTNTYGLAGRILTAPLWAKLAEKIGAKRGLGIAAFLCAFTYFVNVGMTPTNAELIRWIAHTIGIFGCAGTAVLVVPVQYSCMPEDKHYAYLSFITVLTGAIAYPLGLLVSGIVKWADGWSVMLGSFALSEMHLLYLACGLCYVATFILLFHSAKRAPESDPSRTEGEIEHE